MGINVRETSDKSTVLDKPVPHRMRDKQIQVAL